jgi:hypothetical protein
MKKLDLLFKAARNDPPPPPPPGFDAKVMHAIQTQPRLEPLSVNRALLPLPLPRPGYSSWPARRSDRNKELSLFEQLDAWFPRLAFGAALVIGAWLIADNWSSGFGQTSLTSDVAQFSDQWLFAVKGF